MLSLALLPFVGFMANLASAVPTASSPKPRTSSSPRHEPVYENFEGIEDREEVLHEAFDDVIQMCNYITTLDVPSFFKEYFYEEDQADIYDVFQTIRGDDDNGGEILESITIDGTDFNDGCGSSEQLGYTVPEAGMTARVHFCDAMWNNGWKVKDEMSKEDLGDTVSWRMDHIGRLYIHEIMHHPGIAAAEDIVYGPLDVRGLTGDEPTKNADSWAWFATQQLWSVLAAKDFAPPAPGDDKDPRCNDGICRIM